MGINMMTLGDLIRIKTVIEERLSRLEKWVESERGGCLEEYHRREKIYDTDELHSKLNRVNQRIDDVLNDV